MENIIGEKFGRLTVIAHVGYTEKNKYGQRHSIWKCQCECGNFVNRTTDVLKRGKSSCGCRQKEILKEMSNKNTTHNLTNSRLYGIYKNMISRCYREKDIHYKSYGMRGITVCDEWKEDKSTFFEWATSNGYKDNLTIERKNNNLGYCKENCTWVTKEEQYKNKRQNIMITYNGKTLCASDWSKLTGIDAQKIRWRYKKGWNASDIFKDAKIPLPEPFKESD